jgi:hypothetical protein
MGDLFGGPQQNYAQALYTGTQNTQGPLRDWLIQQAQGSDNGAAYNAAMRQAGYVPQALGGGEYSYRPVGANQGPTLTPGGNAGGMLGPPLTNPGGANFGGLGGSAAGQALAGRRAGGMPGEDIQSMLQKALQAWQQQSQGQGWGTGQRQQGGWGNGIPQTGQGSGGYFGGQAGGGSWAMDRPGGWGAGGGGNLVQSFQPNAGIYGGGQSGGPAGFYAMGQANRGFPGYGGGQPMPKQ